MKYNSKHRKYIKSISTAEAQIYKMYQVQRIHLKRISINGRVNKGVKPISSKYYYAFDDIDELGLALEWSEEDVQKFDSLIDKGLNASEIAEYFQRPLGDVVILALDRTIKRGLK